MSLSSVCVVECLKTQGITSCSTDLKKPGKPFLSGTGAVSPKGGSIDQEEAPAAINTGSDEERGLMNRLNRIEDR